MLLGLISQSYYGRICRSGRMESSCPRFESGSHCANICKPEPCSLSIDSRKFSRRATRGRSRGETTFDFRNGNRGWQSVTQQRRLRTKLKSTIFRRHPVNADATSKTHGTPKVPRLNSQHTWPHPDPKQKKGPRSPLRLVVSSSPAAPHAILFIESFTGNQCVRLNVAGLLLRFLTQSASLFS
jgi:hypothetical protein